MCHGGSSSRVDTSVGNNIVTLMAIDIGSLLVAGGTKAQSMKPSSGSPDSDGVWEIWWKITRWQKLVVHLLAKLSSNQVGSTFPHRILSNPHGCLEA